MARDAPRLRQAQLGHESCEPEDRIMVCKALTLLWGENVSGFRTHAALILGFAGLTALAAPSAHADIVHSVRFRAEAQIIVWGEEISHDAAPIAARMQLASHNAAPDFTAPIVQTGYLVPVRPDLKSLHQTGQSRASFYVASNVAYGIRAEITRHASDQTALQHIPFLFRVSGAGAKAYAPKPGAVIQAAQTLADLAHPKIVFQSAQRTAQKPGTIAEQSVHFTANWGQAAHAEPTEITFTVFVP
jgi:hypothetical protein